MSTPPETKRNFWVLPGMIVWGFAPAVLIIGSILGGWHAGDMGIVTPGQPGNARSYMGDAMIQVAVFGMPIILYPWSVSVLLRYRVRRWYAALIGIPLAAVMCAVNLFLGMTGCTTLAKIFPKEGIF